LIFSFSGRFQSKLINKCLHNDFNSTVEVSVKTNFPWKFLGYFLHSKSFCEGDEGIRIYFGLNWLDDIII